MARVSVIKLIFVTAIVIAATLAPGEHLASALWPHPSLIRCVDTREKVVALTYDDGPHPIYTPQLLRMLAGYQVKATFFMIGSRMQRWPGIVRATAEGGHVVANHTSSHPRDLAKDPYRQIAAEVSQWGPVRNKIISQRSNLFRPPRGLVGPNLLWVAQQEGYQTVLWSVSAYHHEARTPQLMAQRVVERVRPGGIVLMHDGRYPMRWKDVAATPYIIEALRKEGYRFVTVPELLRMGPPLAFPSDSGDTISATP